MVLIIWMRILINKIFGVLEVLDKVVGIINIWLKFFVVGFVVIVIVVI